MPNWTKIAQTMAEGEFGEDWAKSRREAQALKSEQLRNTLAQNADMRAAAGEAREAEANEYGKTRRGQKEAMDVAALEAAGLSNQQARLAVAQMKAKEEAFNLAGGAQGEANETMAERKRREQDQIIEQERLKLEARRTATGEASEADQAKLRAEALKEAQRKNRFGDETYTGAVGAENYQNSEEAREERRRAANLAGLRNAGSEGPIYDSIANDLMEIDARRKQRRQGASAPPQKPVKERAGSSATAWKPRKDK